MPRTQSHSNFILDADFRPYTTQSSLYAVIDQNLPAMKAALQELRRHREVISQQKYLKTFVLESLEFLRADPKASKSAIKEQERSYKEESAKLKDMQTEFDQEKANTCLQVMQFFCNAVSRKLIITNPTSKSMEAEANPRAKPVVEMHEGIVNLINEYWFDLLQSGGLRDRICLRIFGHHCIYRKTYEELLVHQAFKMMFWFVSGQYDPIVRTC